MPFTGELMICVVCGVQMQSHLEANTDWRCLELDGKIFYCCSDEFPPDGSSQKSFQTAYELALACCLSEMLKQQGKAGDPDVEAFQARKSLMRIQRCQRSKPKGFGN